jgi:hypothetical protein
MPINFASIGTASDDVAVVDIYGTCGDDWDATLQFVDDDTTYPVDLSGLTAKLQVKQIEDGTAIATFSSSGASPAFTVTGTSGLLTLDVSSTVTSSLTVGEYKYDLQVGATTYMRGGFSIEGQVTV